MAEHLSDAAVLCDSESRDPRFVAVAEALRKYADTLQTNAV
jgi:hypothetical protein